MTNAIVRYGVTKRWSDAVVHGSTAYFVEVPDDPSQEAIDQFSQVFRQVEARLIQLGSDMKKLIQVIVYLPNPTDLPAFNELWDQWIPDGFAPVRACVHVQLAAPSYRVELVVTAGSDRLNS